MVFPPDSGTLKIAENVFGVNRIRPSARHAPPRNNGALASVRTPPSRSTRFSQPSAPNPIERLSGDQNGITAFSVPASGCTETAPRERSHSCGRPSAFATNTTFIRQLSY